MANWPASLVLAATILLAPSAILAPSAAETQAPAKTGEFVKFCSNNAKPCFSKIQAVDVGNMAGALWAPNAKNKSVCPIPDGVNDDMARVLIVGWLGRHPETTNLDTDAGITLAIKQIWSCRMAITGADAKTPSGGPSRTAEFLAYCKTRIKGCYNDILVVDLSIVASQGLSSPLASHCQAPPDVTTEALGAKVLDWLGEHPEDSRLKINDSVVAAIDATWPCR